MPVIAAEFSFLEFHYFRNQFGGKIDRKTIKTLLKTLTEIQIIRGSSKPLIVVKIHLLSQSIEILLMKIVSIEIILLK